MFNTILIANRGEIACRIIRTLKSMGIKSISIYSDTDCNAQHVKDADISISIGGSKANDSYLCINKIISAAIKTKAEAIFPGYGFLSESLAFANACKNANITFIGPTADQIAIFGLKHSARKIAINANIPVILGTPLLTTLNQALIEANYIGYPVMLKSTAGGGGIGITRCANSNELIMAWDSVRRLSKQFFSNADVFLEHCIDYARHIEVQIFGDGNGNVVTLGERDCSLQRRNQKIIEETPAPNLPETIRNKLLISSIRLGKLVNYRSVGTVEYIYDPKKEKFYFLEVNTRLQVEHTVTECVTNLDLVKYMILLAAGKKLDWNKLQQLPHGTSIEVRLYAEDPLKNFQPSPGILTMVNFPKNIRVDTWINTGTEISSLYDPMLGKIIAYGNTRNIALKNLQTALNSTQLYGISTNIDYLRNLISTKEFKDGKTWTKYLDYFKPLITPVIEVIEPGTCTSIQDYPGRLGYWNVGVPISGPMDDFAFRIANRIVGNHESSAGLEFTLIGPTLRFHCDAIIALTGANFNGQLDNKPVVCWKPITVKAEQILVLSSVQSGCRGYLAVRNGFDVPKYLGSRSTFALGGFGGHAGRNLQISDMLLISQPHLDACTTPSPYIEPKSLNVSLIPHYNTIWDILVLCGPHGAPDFFTKDFFNDFFSCTWKVHYNSNRLGIRLIGPKPKWSRVDGGEAGLHPSNIHDCEYSIGAINFTGDFPVILSHDGPSLGGFVCLATIIKAELWKLGQLKPGDRIHFHLTTIDKAIYLEKTQLSIIDTLHNSKLCESFFNIHSIENTINSIAILATIPATKVTPTVIYRQSGDKCILIEYGDNILDLGLRLRVYLLMNAINNKNIPGIKELSPGVRSLQIRYDNHIINQTQLIKTLLLLESTLGEVDTLNVSSRIVWMPMAFEDSITLNVVKRYQETLRYDAPWLPNNIDFIQRINGLSSREEVRNIIFNASYLVLGLGDVYLGAPCAVAIDPRHRLFSSKYNPARTFTSEGTVGIGGMYMCIYGMDSPGGYQLIGRTLPIWNKFVKNNQFSINTPWLLKFFDQVRFYPVNEKEIEQLRNDFYNGNISICIEETNFDFGEYKQFLINNDKSIMNFRKSQYASFQKEINRWIDEDNYDKFKVEEILSSTIIPKDNNLIVVRADMSGHIWKILVNIGDQVKVGEVLIVIEAMKMELNVIAQRAGCIKNIFCSPGIVVNTGDVLLCLECNSE